MPLARAILLRPDGSGLVLANGLDYPTPPEFQPEPSATLVKKRDGSGNALLGAGSGKSLWRELPAMTVKRRMGETGGPLVLSEFERNEDIDLWIGALVTDKASILDAVESVYRLPPRMFGESGRALYESEVQRGEKVGMALIFACKTYRQMLEIKPQGYPEKEAAVRRYWNEVEQHSCLLLDHLRADEESAEAAEALDAWRNALWRAAHSALQACCSSETPRQMRAFALARRELNKERKQLEKKDSTQDHQAA